MIRRKRAARQMIRRELYLLALATGALTFSWMGEAVACGVPPGDINYLFPDDGASGIATNAKLIARYMKEPTYRLRKLGSTTVPTLDAAASSNEPVEAGTTGATPIVAASDGGDDEVPLDTMCDWDSQLCILTASLEPHTTYVWSSTSFQSYPQTFTTGSGERSPAPLPSINASVVEVDWGAMRGECGAPEPITISAEFDASSEPWILVSGNRSDGPVTIASGTTNLVWDTVDFNDCIKLTQVNWAGESFDSGLDICPPVMPADVSVPFEPHSTADDTSTAAETGDDASVSTPTETDKDASVSTPTEAVDSSDDDARDTTDKQATDTRETIAADSGTTNLPASDESSDCNCRLGTTTSPSSAAGVGLLVLGLLFRRRSRAMGR